MLGACFALGGLSAQVPHFRVEELPDDFEVKEMIMDQEGFIWAGNKGLIYRYDGQNWDGFNNPVETSKVSSMQVLKNGEIWVGHENGQVCFLKHKKFVLYEPEEGLPSVPISAIAEDTQGNIWFATYGEGLYFHNGRHLYQRSMEDGLSDNDIYDLIADTKGNLFAGSDGGLMQLSWQEKVLQIKQIGESEGLPDLIVRELALGIKGEIWLGMHEGGVAAYYPEKDSFSVLTSPEDRRLGSINKLLALETELIIGTKKKGLWAWNGFALRPWLREGRERIDALLTDSLGQLFVQSSARGFLSTSYRFQQIPSVPSKVQAVYGADNGLCYFATENGLFSIDPSGNIDSLLYPTELNIISLSEKEGGDLLVGTFGQGIVIVNPDKRESLFFTEKNGLINDNIISIAKQGEVHWIATLGGVSRCQWQADGEVEITNFDQKDGLGTNYIYHVFVDSKGSVWFGTDGHGAYLFEGENIQPVKGLAEHNVYSIAEDREGNIWFVTEEDMLFRLHEGNIRRFEPNGLKGIQAAGLLCDDANFLLITHEKGVSLVDAESQHTIPFGAEVGLDHFEADLNVMAHGKRGRIWLGSPKGLYVFQSTIPLQSLPKTRIKGVSVYRDSLTQDPFSLTHDQNNISFDFAGLWYQKPAEVRFHYRLVGLSPAWQETGDNKIPYPKLAPGSYRFELATTIDGVKRMPNQVHFDFQIHYPFWQKWWFILLTLGAILYGVFLLWRYRERQLHKQELQEQEKIRFQFETLRSQVNPHFLFNSFNTLINLIDEEPEIAIQYVEKLSDLFRNMLAFRDQNSISLAEELVILGDYFFLQKKRYGDKLELEIDIDASLKMRQIIPLSLQMLVENAVKHNVISQAKPLHISIKSEGEYLVIQNPIQAKRNTVPSTKLGLQNIRRRYSLLTELPVEVYTDTSYFIVNIPLLPS